MVLAHLRDVFEGAPTRLMIARELLEHAIAAKRDARVYLCERSFALFAMYYFAEFFTYAVPAFQWAMYEALDEFVKGRFRFLLWVLFRESAKSTIAKIYVVYCVAYRKKRFINWDSYDKANSEAALFDIATWLQTNHRLVADFGQLFYEDRKAKDPSMKRIGEFITTNRVKVKAYSTQEGTRGRIFDRFRPDLYVVDDFETAKTIESVPVTAKIVKHIDELKSGLSVDGQILFLANYISEVGTVAGMLEEAKENPASWRTHFVPVEKDGVIAWPDKYVATIAEAAVLNEGRPPKERVVPLDQLRKDLNASGRKVYESEMLNNPEAAGEPFFKREKVDYDLARAKLKRPLRVVGGFSLWEEHRSKDRYAIGADTSKGVGRDSCTSVAGRFSALSTQPAVVVGTYASNIISPDLFAYELKAQANLLGGCLIAPELNNTGYATVTQLKAIYPQHMIYRQVREEQIGKQATKDLGWEATSSNVAAIYYAFRSAYDDGEVEVYCPALLAEIRTLTKRDLEQASRRSEMDGMTRHFDLLRAACIWWEMRHHAAPPVVKPKPLAPREPVSEYHGGE